MGVLRVWNSCKFDSYFLERLGKLERCHKKVMIRIIWTIPYDGTHKEIHLPKTKVRKGPNWVTLNYRPWELNFLFFSLSTLAILFLLTSHNFLFLECNDEIFIYFLKKILHFFLFSKWLWKYLNISPPSLLSFLILLTCVFLIRNFCKIVTCTKTKADREKNETHSLKYSWVLSLFLWRFLAKVVICIKYKIYVPSSF